MRRAAEIGRGWRGAGLAAVVLLGAVGGGESAADLPDRPDPAVQSDTLCRTDGRVEGRLLDRHAARAATLPPPRIIGAGAPLVSFPAPVPLTDTGAFERGSVVDMGEVIVLVDDGSGLFGDPFNAGGIRLDPIRLSQAYYLQRPDDVDTLAFFPNFNQADGTFHVLIRNAITGINRPTLDDSARYGSAGRLQSVLVFTNLNNKPLDPAARIPTDHNTHLSLVAHEWAHRFGAFVRFDDPSVVSPSTALLGRGFAHWCFFHATHSAFGFPSGMSALEGNRWVRGVGDSWRTQGATDGYSPLDLYLMGFLAPAEVPPFFYLEPPPNSGFTCDDSPVSAPPQSPQTVTGQRRDVTVQDVVAVEGARSPDHTQSQRDFRMAFVLLARTGRFPAPAEVARLEQLRQAWEPYFSTATGGRATIDTSTGPPPGPAETFAMVRLPSQIQAGHPFSFALMALDAQGRVATGYRGTVRFSSAGDPGATLPGDLVFDATHAGYREVPEPAIFSVGGFLALTATDLLDPLVTGTRTAIEVEPPSLIICVPGDPDPADPSPNPWGRGSSFLGNGGVRFQYLVHRDLIGRPGLVTGLNWALVSSPERVDWDGVSVTMAHKPGFNLLTIGDPDPLARNLQDSIDVTQVLIGRVSRDGLADASRLHFTTAPHFPYNGLDHLLVEVHYVGGVPPGLETDQITPGPDFLAVEQLGSTNSPVSSRDASTICLGVRLPGGILPTITGLTVESIGNTMARIGWRTSPATDGRVLFGVAGSPPDRTTAAQRYDVVHSVEVTGLLPGTTYDAVAESHDIDNQVTQAGPVAFTTTEFRPSITELFPRSLPQGTLNTLVRVQGENFFQGLSVEMVEAVLPPAGPPVPDALVRVAAFNRLSEQVIDLGVEIDSTAPPGPRRLRVVNNDGFETVSSVFFGVEPPASAVDIDASGRVDGFDLARLARAFGARFPDPRYELAVDLDGDGVISGTDLARLADRFGR